MGSVRYPKTAFMESDLSELEWVLESVFEALGSTDEETKAILRRKLFLLACNGIDNAEKLRATLVASAQRIDERSKARSRLLGYSD
jgi:hypothetical protein